VVVGQGMLALAWLYAALVHVGPALSFAGNNTAGERDCEGRI